MGITVSGQTLEFLNSAVLGAALAVFYDVLRVVRAFTRAGRLITALIDGFFWFCAVCALFFFVLTVSEGRMRWYVLLGVFCGGFFYMSTISVLFYGALRVIINVIVKSIVFCVRPLYIIAGKTYKKARAVKRRIIIKMRARAKLRAMKKEEKRKKRITELSSGVKKGRMYNGAKSKKKKSRINS